MYVEGVRTYKYGGLFDGRGIAYEYSISRTVMTAVSLPLSELALTRS